MATPIKKTRLPKTSKDYINNKQFTQEILRCKYGLTDEETGKQYPVGELSNRAVNYFITLAGRAIHKVPKLRNPLDKEDFIQSALLDLVKYWRNFDETKSNNAFAYFTQISKNGYAKEHKRIYRQVGVEKGERVEVISLSHGGDSEIYSL